MSFLSDQENRSESEKIKILIGLKTDQKTFELLQQARGQQELLLRSHAEVKEELSAEVLSELEHGNDSAQLEQGKETFITWIKSGKLQVKVYPSAKIDAKVYIMTLTEGDRGKGRIVAGSSDFSQSGFCRQSGIQCRTENSLQLRIREQVQRALGGCS
jgi:hypothetical protein